MLKAVYFEANNSLVDEFLKWLNKHPQKSYHLGEVRDLQSSKFDEFGIPYASDEEEQEVAEILKNPECHEVAFSSTISLNKA